MQNLPTRRTFLLASSAFFLSGCAGVRWAQDRSFNDRLLEIREQVGGRIGVYALDTESRAEVAFDAHSRYAMASTFKWLLVAAVLAQVDTEQLLLSQQVSVGENDMLSHAPVSSKFIGRGWMTIEQLCAAAVVFSDNPAANLLLDMIGGPAALTGWVRANGDEITRLDRKELELNTNLPNDPRDTTTPRAMVDTMERVLLGSVLSERSREMLLRWMQESESGARRIRASVPAGWRAADKTGTGMRGAVNDVAILWPPDRAPILMAMYMSGSEAGTPALEAAQAQITELVLARLVTSDR